MGNSRLEEIAALIEAEQSDQARDLLRTEIKDLPSADAWFLASRVAISENQQVEFLEKALELDPFHKQSYEMLRKLRGANQPPIEQPRSRHRTVAENNGIALEKELLEKTVAIFGKFGWNLTLSTENTRTFEKNVRMDGRSTWVAALVLAVFVYFFLSSLLAAIIVFGLFALVANVALLAQRDHVTVQTTGKGYILVTSSVDNETRTAQTFSQIENMARNPESAGGIPGCAEPVIIVFFLIVFVVILVLAGLSMFL